MARVSKVEICLFCGYAPCECVKRTTTRSKVSKPRPIVIAAELPKEKVSMLDAMRAAAVDAPKFEIKQKSYPQVIHRDVVDKPVIEDSSIDDLLLADSIRNFAPLLHPDELEKYRMQITSTPTLKERAQIWRARQDG